MKNIRLSFSVMCFFLSINLIEAQDYKFKHLTTQDGLLHDNITSIIQDSKGFIWIGTYSGLHRYDGANLKVFTNSRFDTTTISSNTIMHLFEDKDQNLWIGCYKGGLNKYDINTEVFEHIHFPNYNEKLETIFSIVQDTSGLIWITNEIGIYSYDPYTNKFLDSYTDFIDTTDLSAVFNSSNLIVTEHNKVMFCYNGAIFQIDADTKQLSKINTPSSIYVSKIVVGSMGEYWITYSNKISQFSIDKGILKSYTTIGRSAIGSLQVSELFIWAGTYDNGLVVIDRKTSEQTLLKQTNSQAFSLSNNNIRVIMEDSFGTTWIGTSEGVSIYYEGLNNFHSLFLDDPLNSEITVTSIAEDKFGNQWYGTLKSGIIKFNPKTKKIVNYLTDPNNKNSIKSNSINSLCFDNNDNLFIATDQGLSVFNYSINKYWHYSKYDSNSFIPAMLPNNLTKDRFGNIWATSWTSGLLKFSFKNQKLSYVHYLPSNNNPYSLNALNTSSIVEDQNGSIWVGTIGGGLNKLELQSNARSNSFSSFKTDPNNLNSIVSNDILSLFVDKDNNIWVGTANQGVSVFQQADSSFINYTINDGLASNVIYSIAQDDFNNIWLSTNKGLSKIDFNTNTIFNFKNEDGLAISNLYLNSFAKMQNGDFVYGGARGIIYFNPTDINITKQLSDIYITDIEINSKRVRVGEKINDVVVLDKSILETESITLPYNASVLSLMFTDIQLSSSAEEVYQYQLEGFDSEWRNSKTKNHRLTYTNLDPGNYTLKIKNLFSDESAAEQIKSLSIKVLPPFWRTWWFISLILIIVISSITLIYRLRTARIKKYAKLLEETVNERTSEINNVNKNLQKANDELSEFAYIVSHDLKSPLRGIGQLATWISQDSAKYLDSDGKDNLSMLIDRVSKMNALIEGMLQYSRAGKRTKELTEIDLNRSVFEVIEFLSLPESVEINVSDNLPIILGEKMKVEQAIQNIITNSVMHTEKDLCKINIKGEESDTYSSIIFEDNGPGIDRKYHKKVFEIFQSLDPKKHSIGLGLSIVKKIMERNGGNVSIVSPLKDNYGTAIVLSFKK